MDSYEHIENCAREQHDAHIYLNSTIDDSSKYPIGELRTVNHYSQKIPDVGHLRCLTLAFVWEVLD